MEFLLKCKESVYPCAVTIDEDNGRYMLRKADSSGEFFNTPEELAKWVFNNWRSEDFDETESFEQLLLTLRKFINLNSG